MRMHVLQHVPFEDAANVGLWAHTQGYELTTSHLYLDSTLPSLDDFDWLVIMGGPMNIYEDDRYPWLAAERRFVAEAIEAGKTVLGVCLGAQLIADALGGKVRANHTKEIGWFEVQRVYTNGQANLFDVLPERFMAFHWHGDTFALPQGAHHLARSGLCENQAFQYGDRVLGLQFHLDYSADSIEKMIEHCHDELDAGSGVQLPLQMMQDIDHVAQTQNLLNLLLDRLRDTSCAS